MIFEAESAILKCSVTLPQSIDARASAATIRRALAGETPLPLPLVDQIARCLYGAGYAYGMNEAMAVLAVKTGGLANGRPAAPYRYGSNITKEKNR